MIQINNKTKIFGILGFPLTHTLSPYIHNTWFQSLNLNALYLVFEHSTDRFQHFVNALKEMKINGFNVTLPYKQKIMKFLDVIDEDALKIGAVNTVVYKNKQYIGYNTDVYGFYKSLCVRFPDWNIRNKKVLLLGAGGAAMAVAYSVLSHHASLTITNRNSTHGNTLKNKLYKIFRDKISYMQLTKEILRKNNNFDLIINATSYGLKEEKQDLIDLTYADKHTKIYELIYRKNTPLLRSAKQMNLSYADGLLMLIYQAERAFRLWGFPKPDIQKLHL